ncbi:MAG: L-glutamate gamma-semialdehyde dehydrogenase [Bacteroidota bacterium]
MATGFFNIPEIKNEPVKSYAPGTPERAEVLAEYDKLWNSHMEIPLTINGEKIMTDDKVEITSPHKHHHVIGHYSKADKAMVSNAIETALEARKKWSKMSWEHRAAIFLKMADLLAGPYRAKMNAATMIGQSKTIHQAEIDAACELIDFFRFNVKYMTQIYKDQPLENAPNEWNRVEHRPLEGFVYAITPFNFTSIAGNLQTSAAMMGNVVVWKPSATQMYSAGVLMELFEEAGLPKGVINMVAGDSAMISDTIFEHKAFAGVHFTGSTGVFQGIYEKIGKNITKYNTYPRIVGETGGKDFVVMHPSANATAVATALSRGAFEFQGQKCSAASRAYIPQSRWEEVKTQLVMDLDTMKQGEPDDMSNFTSAVISQSAFDKLSGVIDKIKMDPEMEFVAGGGYDDKVGYFIDNTVAVTTNPKNWAMETEFFGPILTIYVYEDEKWEETLKLVDTTSPYALTGAIFSSDRYAAEEATDYLEGAAGNFYINDKPTGAVVGQQPFGGARGSGTNDKAGSMLNLVRWVSPRLIKENFVSPKDYRYPFMGK